MKFRDIVFLAVALLMGAWGSLTMATELAPDQQQLIQQLLPKPSRDPQGKAQQRLNLHGQSSGLNKARPHFFAIVMPAPLVVQAGLGAQQIAPDETRASADQQPPILQTLRYDVFVDATAADITIPADYVIGVGGAIKPIDNCARYSSSVRSR